MFLFQGHTDELWGLATHPFKDLLLTCAQDRQVCMWNSVEHRLEWTRLVDVSKAKCDYSFPTETPQNWQLVAAEQKGFSIG